MRTIFLVFITNFKRAYSNKKKFFINLLVPVAAILLAIITNYISSPTLNIGVVQKKYSESGNRIISLLKSTKGLKIKMAEGKLIKTQVILGKYDAVIIIKRDVDKNAVQNFDKYFEVYNVKNSKINIEMKNMIKRYLVTNKALKTDKLIDEMQDGSLSKAERIISFLATVFLITSVVNGAVVIRDREENTFYRYLYSPNGKFKYIFGNVLYNYVFSYIQFFISISIVNIFGINIGIAFEKMVVYGFLLILVMTTLATFITCIFTKELYANMSSAAISLILALIGGTFINYNKMPYGLQKISVIIPNRWIIKSVQYLEYEKYNSVNPMLILMAFSVIFSIAAVVASKFHKVVK